MKRIISLSVFVFTCLLLSCFVVKVNAQSVSISDDGTAALPSAMLEIKVSAAAKKGVLIPRMTTTQRNAIASPAKGLLVYDSTVKSFWFHNGSAWTGIATGGQNPWTVSGINMYNNIPNGLVGIGLTNPKAKLHVGPNKTVVFGPDSLSSQGGGQFVWFSSRGALRFRSAYSTSTYPEPVPYTYSNIGENSLAIGESTAGYNSLAIGNSAEATGDYTFAQGFGVMAQGSGSMARGTYCIASGLSSYTNGLNNVSYGDYSFTNGNDLTATAANCFVLGRYNDPIAGSDMTNWVEKDPIFIIGNGDGSPGRNAFVILKNWVTGIGKNPVGDVASWGMIQVRNVDAKEHISFIQNTTTNRWGMAVPDAGTADLIMKYNGVSRESSASLMAPTH